MIIETEKELRQLYGFPQGRAKLKQLSYLEKHSINFIQKSPFLIISTSNINGMLDCSPRGGGNGFVKIIDTQKFIIPDSKGNNRLDSLINIIESKQIGCLFLIPGVDETLRINGVAKIKTDKHYLAHYSNEKNSIKSVIEVEVKEVFLHCAKALMRSSLWSASSHISRSELPTMGKMLNEQIGVQSTPESQEDMVRRYLKDL